MIRIAFIAVLAWALLAAAVPCALAQGAPGPAAPDVPPAAAANTPAAVVQDPAPVTAPAPPAPAPPASAVPATPPTTTAADPPPAASEAPLADRITGIETNREMIAAEAPTEIVINGTLTARCGLVVDFGDGTRSANVVSGSSPFPLRLNHTYPKSDEFVVRVKGVDDGSAPPCEGGVEAAIHVSPAGSKIEYITLTSECPEGWKLKGVINPDKSFMCAPIPDASAATNLIHCIDGMKYFVKDGHVGCRHPQAVMPEQFAKAKTPKEKGKGVVAQGKAPLKSAGFAAKTRTPAPKAAGKRPGKTPVNAKVAPRIGIAEAPN